MQQISSVVYICSHKQLPLQERLARPVWAVAETVASLPTQNNTYTTSDDMTDILHGHAHVSEYGFSNRSHLKLLESDISKPKLCSRRSEHYISSLGFQRFCSDFFFHYLHNLYFSSNFYHFFIIILVLQISIYIFLVLRTSLPLLTHHLLLFLPTRFSPITILLLFAPIIRLLAASHTLPAYT